MRQKLRTYTVTGHGEFPQDMLRYDSAWASRSADAGAIEDSYNPNTPRRWTLELPSYSEPTIGRWNSFLVAVDDVRVVV